MKKKCIAAAISFILLLSYIPENFAYAVEYPEKYRTEEVTEVKNQGAFNLCWAYAGVSVMETELIKNNKASKDLNLSELQLAYFMVNPAMDPLGQHTRLFSGSQNFNQGSDCAYFLGLLGAGLSPLQDSSMPLDIEEVSIETKFDASLEYDGDFYLKEGIIIRNISREEIKDAILEYGSVLISYNANTAYYNENTFGWFNPKRDENGLYPNSHAVAIIGWDDTYSKKNFNDTPKGNGAWIVKNSWGSEWGDEGYFYLSYYDGSILDSAFVVLDMEPGAFADNIYQNTFSASSGLTVWTHEGKPNERAYGNYMRFDKNIKKVANVFTAQANDVGAEILKGVSVYTHSAADYEIKIYKNIKENINPEGGKLVATLKGSIEPGFKIIPVDNFVYLSEGESFSIVADLRDSEGQHVGVDYGDQEVTLATMGQSFVYAGNTWHDCTEWLGYNLFINAYTDNISKMDELDAKKITMKTTIKVKDYAQNIEELDVIFTDSNSAILSWGATKDNFYVIYKYNSTAGTWQKVGYTDKTYYIVNGLSAGEEYTFGVKGIAQAPDVSSRWMPYYESPKLIKVSTKTSASEQIVPTLQVDVKGNVLTWKKLSGATKYVIYVMSPATDYEWKKLSTVESTKELTYTDTTALWGLNYSYRIYAYEKDKLISKGIPVSGLVE